MWFKCFIEGENFPGELIGEESMVGFCTTRYVEADSIEEAESKVMGNLRHEESLKLAEGVKPSEEAKVYFESIEEISKSEVPESDVGFTFYVMGT
jgi:hypothetical protein